MAIPFRIEDAVQLTAYHRQLLDRLDAVEPQVQSWLEQLPRALDQLAEYRVGEILSQIPVEELNREKRGVRVKTLRDCGYASFADLASASTNALAAINGISDEGAVAIKQMVTQMTRTARQGMKLRLSADDRSPAATNVVQLISQYRRGQAAARSCKAQLSQFRKPVEDSIRDLNVVSGRLKWLFLGKEKKQRAIEAFQNLSNLRTGSFGRESEQLCSSFSALQALSPEQAWQDFLSAPIPFTNLIEQVRPGLMGSDDAEYGLPEDLAREIEQQPFDPKGLKCQLRRYQIWGVKYALHQKRALLGDEMGLGKTVQAIACMVSLRNEGHTHFAVVCPASVITNWCREIEQHSDLRVIRIHGSDRETALTMWLRVGGVAVTTFETTAYLHLPADFRYTMLVVDEAHYIKNPDAQRTVNTRQLASHADRLLFMTGTALENRVDEMISLIGVLQPRVAEAVRGMEALSAAPRFRQAVAPVYYRRKRESVLTELPELIESREWCQLGNAERAVYEQAILDKKFADARRVSWNAPRLQDSSKAARLLEIVEAAKEDGRKVIVFSFFLDTIAKVRELLGDCCSEPINGSVPPAVRQEIIDRFDKAPAGSVLAAQIQSGGTGLNIQSASVVVLCEPQFKPSIENQAISRAYRMGQARNVLVYRLLSADTLDEEITALLMDKQQVFDAFADDSVTADDTRELDQKHFAQMLEAEAQRIRDRQNRTETVENR